MIMQVLEFFDIGKILVSILTLVLVTWQDLSKYKDPYDQQSKKFRWKFHWWRFRWDNLLVMWTAGIIGSVLSNELAMPIITKYLDFKEFAERTFCLFNSFIVTYLFAKYLSKIVNIK